MAPRRVSRVVSVAIVVGERVLAVERSPDDSFPLYWELPGDSVEPGESFERAAVRELAEETGISGVPLLEIYHVRRPPLLPGTTRYALVEEAGFLGRLVERPPVRLAPKEHSDHRWLAEAELGSVRMAEPKRSLARLALRTRGAP